ncbi:hypothetical protein JJQ59_35030 (plasmid) [Cupriavidus necator]|uniref:phospholipase D n=1 Tax=Cupriavidus necator TaxID=106590 RepID=A0A367PS71_CUPNE|nr:phospholipase D-like domain-containing protein [Cupriavidus necator]QQX89739.1 hypothetical protein JJQ59_35030 [Cupriavidus necator]RCJ10463.1 hypothetical protein DDK22_00420 [Cupriavidus necator]
MRAYETNGDLEVRAVSGTRVVLLAWNIAEEAREGLRGFAIKRRLAGDTGPGQWLTGLKYFSSLVPAPVKGKLYESRKHPFQTFLWSEYTLDPETSHQFAIVALYGSVDSMEERYAVQIDIQTEKEDDGKHGVWFNRGVIASHAFASQFQNKPVTDAMFTQLDARGELVDSEVRWLSRGLAEACLSFIRETKKGEALRVCAYEFTYGPVLDALASAIARGVDVRIVYHDSKDPKDKNVRAIQDAGLPKEVKVDGESVQILFPRTRTNIPHNKFIVRLSKDVPRTVWTGSTNFTATGIFGQTNVGHLLRDKTVAATYLKYWEELSSDPTLKNAVAAAVKLTPNPPNAPFKASTTPFFSPRVAQNMLDWYSQRLDDAASLALITLPFDVAPEILKGLASADTSLRMAILENPPTKEVLSAEKKSGGRLAFSNGAILGKTFVKRKTSFGGATQTKIQSPLDQWFLEEELARPINSGHVFFVHSKFLLIDPLSEDPLVCTGSANFSKNSLVANDENMLLIRGDKRVADIYLTEFDRIFRHFYARDGINAMAKKGSKKNPLELDESSDWMKPYFKAGTFKNNRRAMFFPDSATKVTPWSKAAAKDADPFEDEAQRAKENRAKKAKKSDDE